MTGLARLESDFQSFVLEGTPGIESAVSGTSLVPVQTRLAIYSDAYRARFAEALGNNFPVLGKLLGDKQFAQLALLYTQRHSSAHYSIRWYGEHLPELLAAENPYREQPLLHELAHWEWNMTLAFDAADMPPLQAAALQALKPEEWAELRIVPHPSCHVLALHSNAPTVWRALNRDEAPPAFTYGEPQWWLIWRRGLDTYFRSSEAVEAGALSFVAGGRSFDALCEMLAQRLGEDHAAEEAAQLLRRWLDDELLAAT